jgi:hypothetical protein
MDDRAVSLDVARRFGQLIVRQEYQAACLLLTKEAQSAHSPGTLKAAVNAMIAYARGPILRSQVCEEVAIEDWPGKRPSDVGIVYVALTGDGFSEAVTLTLARELDGISIRDLAWGRP